jgi:hypothetical protein
MNNAYDPLSRNNAQTCRTIIMTIKIVKDDNVDFLTKFKSKRPPTIAGVETMLTALPVLKISDANDWVRLHPCEETHWSPELCFVSVPVQGGRDLLHLIDEDLAMQYLSVQRVKRQRLALACKPHNNFFLCIIPSQNIDNTWNTTNLTACHRAQEKWVQATSRRGEGVDGYKIDLARDVDAFPEPTWPTRSFASLVEITFRGASIDTDPHPALSRLIGAKPDLT